MYIINIYLYIIYIYIFYIYLYINYIIYYFFTNISVVFKTFYRNICEKLKCVFLFNIYYHTSRFWLVILRYLFQMNYYEV